ncbi:MAG: PEP-CTERM sorting domain-containing protein [Kiritimatiellales bacterium]
MQKKWMVILGLCLLTISAAHATLITDAMDFSGSWTNIGGGWFSAGVGGLTPVEGTGFWTATGSGGNNRGAWKLFDAVFAEEKLQVSYYVGDRDDKTVYTLQTFLFADVNDDGIYTWTERITVTDSTSRPTPDAGWQNWVDTYQITASTVTSGGDSVLGKKIGFAFLNAMPDSTYGISVDSLSIQTVPEPATIGMLGLAAVIVIGFRRRFHL